MADSPPKILLLAGPNGAGKSTVAKMLIAETLALRDYVNADTIARGLSEFHPEDWAVKAGKIMLEHLHALADTEKSFAFETTLASRSFLPWIVKLRARGYQFHLVYLWLRRAEMAVQRVRERVNNGGHNVLTEIVLRRYLRGMENFFRLYRPVADSWYVFDNSMAGRPKLVAQAKGTMEEVFDQSSWDHFRAGVKP